jgi:hypothetical protein
VRDHRASDIEHAADVGVEDGADVVVVERRKLVVADDSRVVDQDVDPLGARRDALDRVGAGLCVADVDLLGADRPARLGASSDDIRRSLRVVAVEERDVGAFVGEKLDDRTADAAAAASDDRDLAGQTGIDLHRLAHPEMQNPPSTTSV